MFGKLSKLNEIKKYYCITILILSQHYSNEEIKYYCILQILHMSIPYLHNALEVPHVGLFGLQYLQRHPLQAGEFGQCCCGGGEGTGSRQQGERGEVQADVGAITLWPGVGWDGSIGER